ncbi:hypothetical protein SHKM778_27900 [Streptomyces sp. KM77-8]|uniref:Uncharacterized protein n=1 Tax=Streptomyces haneummycinicus TaxID=3074435 RepID=A0AAT9HG74_9ACTN
MIATKFRSDTAPHSSLPTRTRALFLVLVSLLATIAAIGLVVATSGYVVTGSGGDSTTTLPCRVG